MFIILFGYTTFLTTWIVFLWHFKQDRVLRCFEDWQVNMTYEKYMTELPYWQKLSQKGEFAGFKSQKGFVLPKFVSFNPRKN